MPSRTRLRRIVSRNTIASAAFDTGRTMRSSPKPAVELGHVTMFVNEAASPHLADFIDAVGKLVSAILSTTNWLPRVANTAH